MCYTTRVLLELVASLAHALFKRAKIFVPDAGGGSKVPGKSVACTKLSKALAFTNATSLF